MILIHIHTVECATTYYGEMYDKEDQACDGAKDASMFLDAVCCMYVGWRLYNSCMEPAFQTPTVVPSVGRVGKVVLESRRSRFLLVQYN